MKSLAKSLPETFPNKFVEISKKFFVPRRNNLTCSDEIRSIVSKSTWKVLEK